MKVKIVFISIVFLVSLTSSAMAVRSWGVINDTYEYANLDIRENPNSPTCFISGEIKNKTSELKDGVYIKIYAFNIHDTLLWSKILFFSTIPSRGKVTFSEKIYDCTIDDPYKLKFKVTD